MANFTTKFYSECAKESNTFAVIRQDGSIDIVTICPRNDNENSRYLGFDGAEWDLLIPLPCHGDEIAPMVRYQTNNVWHRGSWENVPEDIKPLFIAKGFVHEM